MVPPAGPLGLVDREPRNLPIPIGDLHPARHRRHGVRLRLWRRRGPDILALVGVLLAVCAALITISRPPLGVYLEGDIVHVAGATLSHPAGNGGVATGRLYQGPATLLLIAAPDGHTVATAVTYLNGERATGVCDFGPPTQTQVGESCRLVVGAQSVTCDDVLRFAEPEAWERHCSDGQSLSVAVPQGTTVIPLPFPLGR